MRALAAVILCVGCGFAKPALSANLACPVAAPPLAPPTQVSPTATLTSDQASLQDDTVTATGHVRIVQDEQALEAETLHYNRQTGHVKTHSGLEYMRPDLFLTAQSGNVSVASQAGTFTQADYVLPMIGGRGQAQTMTSLGNGHFSMTDASYTTCAGTTKAWQLSASTFKVNRNTGRAKAYNAVLHFYNVPVFYSPYLNFPVDGKRHSGMLVPEFGHSNDSGYEFTLPWYFNLAPNYDATLLPRYLSLRGLQVSGQFRYLTRHQRGELDGSILPDDNEYGDTRSLINFRHDGRLTPHVGIRARFANASDNDYFTDLTSDLSKASHSHLERSLELSWASPGVDLSVMAQGFQNLREYNDSSLPKLFHSEPYKRLPVVRMNLLSQTAPFRIGLDSEFADFQSSSAPDAMRTDVRPHLDWSTDHGGWFADSELGWRYTRYHFTDNDPTRPAHDISRDIPSFSLGGGMRFMRTFDSGWVQTLTPRIKYLYKGYDDQSNIPLFDTGLPDLTVDRLFSGRRLVGRDRILDTSQLTLGLTSRFISPDSGRTVLQFDLGRIKRFTDQRVSWPGINETGMRDAGSDYVAGVEYRPTGHFSTGLIVQYDAQDNNLNRALAHIDYHNDDGLRLNLAWRRYRNFRPLRNVIPKHGTVTYVSGASETMNQTVVGLGIPLGDRLRLVGRWNYSLEDSRTVETIAGLEFRPSCCWAARLGWHKIVSNDLGRYDRAIMFQIVLRGLAAFGDRANSITRGNIFDDRLTRYENPD